MATFERDTRILITGGAGFIGHHFVEHLMRTEPNVEVVLLDRLDAAGNLMRFPDIETYPDWSDRVTFLYHDLKAPIRSYLDRRIGHVDYVVHLAAASHVDRSITHPYNFVMDNVVGTVNLLDWLRSRSIPPTTLYFSTDEVYGPAPDGVFYREGDRHNPGNPYAASKAAAESLVRAYRNTYELPLMISNTMNVFGERQDPEKFIPMTIGKCLRGDRVIIHADETRTVPGSRFYLHARNAAAATIFLLRNGDPWEETEDQAESGTYHIIGQAEVTNLELAQKIWEYIASMANIPNLDYELVDFHSSRPGHDLRYAMDGEKLAAMGFQFPVTFEQSLLDTIAWTLDNPEWLQ